MIKKVKAKFILAENESVSNIVLHALKNAVAVVT